MLFSLPADFTPVCSTVRGCRVRLSVCVSRSYFCLSHPQELAMVAKLMPEFDRRGCKVLGLAVDDGMREQPILD